MPPRHSLLSQAFLAHPLRIWFPVPIASIRRESDASLACRPDGQRRRPKPPQYPSPSPALSLSLSLSPPQINRYRNPSLAFFGSTIEMKQETFKKPLNNNKAS
eukprot:TRINITY_DN124_c1_g1_i1.p1 TRINITY_DN124_c1_g1~~TRINITY_DN124_c1_g1_i1.p1  ORF type:complete len:103 (-),score=11.73 TRINITY_DN124_c1_g1_i1:147-455(-)